MGKWLKGEGASSDFGIWGYVKEREKYSFNDLEKWVKKKPTTKKTSASGSGR